MNPALGKKHLPGIHGLRACAALFVVVYHTAYINNPALAVPYLLAPAVSNMGMSVHLFFIVSMFSLMHSYDVKSLSKGWVPAYAISRYFRIAPLFYAMIIYNYGYWITSLSAPVLAQNLTFTFNLFPWQNSGVIWAGWTLGVEMPIYCILPFVISRHWDIKQWCFVTFVTFLISFAARWIFVGASYPYDYAYYSILGNLAAFTVGGLVFRLANDQSFDCRFLLAIGSLSFLALIVIPNDYFISGAHHYQTLLWFLPLGLICLSQALRPSHILSSSPMQWIGERSFSIYLLHPFVIYKLSVAGFYIWMYAALNSFGSWAFVVCALASILVVLPLAAITYLCIERPGQLLGRILIRSLTRKTLTHPNPLGV
jgi:peptidoglycan/LPS O-acetylase OafA/YrhL